jgi:hypothetical protein
MLLAIAIRCELVYTQPLLDSIKPCSDEVFASIQQFFNYDKNIALNAKIVDQNDYKEYVREKLVFTGFIIQLS